MPSIKQTPWSERVREGIHEVAPMIPKAVNEVRATPTDPRYQQALTGQYTLGGDFLKTLNGGMEIPGLGTALNTLTQTAAGQGAGNANVALNAGGPALDAAVKAAINPVMRTFQRETMPGIRSMAIGQGAYGGNREGLSQAAGASEAAGRAMDVTAGMTYADLQAALQRQLLAQQAAYERQMGAATALPGITTGVGQVGTQMQTQAGQGLVAEQERLPFRGINQGVDLLSLLAGTGSQQSVPGPSALTQGIQAAGGLGGLALGGGALLGSMGGLSGLMSLFGGGAGAGAAAGALPALGFSDVRLKEDIDEIGRTFEGLPIYKYHYKGSDEPRMGVMAQEVAQVNPAAVAVHPSGYLMVDYGAVR